MLTGFLLARIAEDEDDARQLEIDLGRWDREREANGPDGTQGSVVASNVARRHVRPCPRAG